MARVTDVQRSRSDLVCGRCQTPIPKGTPYSHASPGFRSAKLVRCPMCPFRQSELTTSKLAGVYSASEDAYENIDAWDEGDVADLRSTLETCAEEARAVAEEYREASQAWGDNGHEEWDALADDIDGWADELESADFIEWEDAAPADLLELEEDGLTEDQRAELSDASDEWAEEQRGIARDALEALPV